MNPDTSGARVNGLFFLPTFAPVTGFTFTDFRKKLFAALLLSALSLGILPVRTLHHLFASHSDEFTGCGHERHRHETCVFDASLVCKTELQVVDLPYEYSSVIFIYSPVRFLDRSFPFYSGGNVVQYDFHAGNRGPPSVIL